jgi:hypothetical protein
MGREERSSRLLGWSWSFRQLKGFRYEIRDFIIRSHAVPGLVGPLDVAFRLYLTQRWDPPLPLASTRVFFYVHIYSVEKYTFYNIKKNRASQRDCKIL